MTIETAMKLIDLGFTTEQIKAFETPDTPAPEPSPVVTPTAEAPVAEVQPSPSVASEPIDYKKLAEEVALYNQRNAIVPPEEPKAEVVKEPEPQPSAQDILLNFLG